jgi:effector-binding domain-containing protein
MAHSKEYLEELKLLHSKKTFGLNKNIPDIVKKLIEEKNIKSFLDYGAGKGHTSNTIKETYPDIELHTFDPATFPNPLPKQVELTYSSDVLEHVEEHLINETLQDLCNRSTRYQYHLIACHPAKKALSDGRNAHLIIENPDWWKSKLGEIEGWNIIHEETTERYAQPKKGPLLHVIKYIVIMEKV